MIVLTDTATEKVRNLMEQEGVADLALRVAVRPERLFGLQLRDVLRHRRGGRRYDDYSGVKVVVDPSSAMLLEGAARLQRRSSRARASPSTTPTLSAPAGARQSFS